MDRRSKAILSLSVVMVLALLVPGGALAKGKPVGGETTNNLSFPAIAVDGFTPNAVPESFMVPYTGDYPGLTAEEILALQPSGPWYAQKVTGNTWQADWVSQDAVNVDVVDWGDNIGSVDAFVRRPYRLEVVLFDDTLDTPDGKLTAYTMAMLGNPSSPDEIQGSNKSTYEHASATVVSSMPKLVIQKLGTTEPTWDAATSRWVDAEGVALPVTPVGFAPELNVGGKYIFGASTGGWKPTVAGVYRVTFYIPDGSGVNLEFAEIAIPVEEEVTAEAEEGGGATPVLVPGDNLSYVDITVRPRNR